MISFLKLFFFVEHIILKPFFSDSYVRLKSYSLQYGVEIAFFSRFIISDWTTWWNVSLFK